MAVDHSAGLGRIERYLNRTIGGMGRDRQDEGGDRGGEGQKAH